MAEAVLDASALIAFLRKEPGAEKVAAVLPRSCISAVNLAETLGKMIEYGKPLEETCYQVERLRIPVVPFDEEQARIAASMWKPTRGIGMATRGPCLLGPGIEDLASGFHDRRGVVEVRPWGSGRENPVSGLSFRSPYRKRNHGRARTPCCKPVRRRSTVGESVKSGNGRDVYPGTPTLSSVPPERLGFIDVLRWLFHVGAAGCGEP